MTDQLPPGWVTRDSASRAGYFYYYNTNTGVSQWDRPFTGKVRVSHLLVKHAGSRNPSSWRETKITRTKDDAIAMLQQYRGMLAQGVPFSELCASYSDCKSAKNGGDLGLFGRGEMQKPFEEAAYALRVGEMTTDIVDTDSGVHILLRTA